MKQNKILQPIVKSRGSILWLLLLVMTVLLAVYFLRSSVFEAKQDESDNKSEKNQKNKEVSVVATPATTGDIPVYLNALGTVTALRTVTVKSRVDGEIVKVAFREGALVKKGDLLFEIDPRPFQIQIQQAQGQLLHDQALLKNSQVDLERYRTLLKQDSIAGQQVMTQESLVMQNKGTVETDKAVLENARLQLDFAKITAPISGHLGLRMLDQGNIVHSQDANGLLVITQIQPIAVIFTLPEDQIPKVMEQLRLVKTLVVDAYDRSGNNKIATGQLLAVDNQIDLNTGTIKLKAKFANENQALFVNQFVNIKMLLETLQGVTIIPSAAVQTGEFGTYVYIVKPDNTVSVQPVKLGAVSGENVVVLDCLESGVLVVVDGIDMLRDNMKVKLINPDSTQMLIPKNYQTGKGSCVLFPR
jgi:multidrug efflux system membrane fusion protein